MSTHYIIELFKLEDGTIKKLKMDDSMSESMLPRIGEYVVISSENMGRIFDIKHLYHDNIHTVKIYLDHT